MKELEEMEELNMAEELLQSSTLPITNTTKQGINTYSNIDMTSQMPLPLPPTAKIQVSYLLLCVYNIIHNLY